MSVMGILGAPSISVATPARSSANGPGSSNLFANALQAATAKINGIQAAAASGLPTLGAKSPSAPTAATGPQSVDLNQLRSQTAQLLANFRGQLNQLLAENGIDTSQPISLQADATGGVQVTSNHPQKDAIEELLADNSELSDTFNQLQQNYALLQQASQAAAPALMPGAPQLGKSATQPGDANAPKFSIVLRNGQASVAYV